MDAKTLTLLLILFVNQIYRATTEASEHTSCLSVEGITPEEELEFDKLDLTSIAINPKLKCLTACFLEEAGVIENCTFNYEAFQKVYSNWDEYQVGAAAEACKDSATGGERCECGFNVYKCIVDIVI